jgi:hypothetical protein
MPAYRLLNVEKISPIECLSSSFKMPSFCQIRYKRKTAGKHHLIYPVQPYPDSFS